MENLTDNENLYGYDPLLSPSEPLLKRIHVRCPDCLKLFVVDPREISEARPKFKCTACATSFWLPYPGCLDHQEVIGFPVVDLDESLGARSKPLVAEEESQVTARTNPCPKCGAPSKAGELECQECGVVFKKYYALLEESQDLPASPRLKVIWDEIIGHYEDESLHQKFLREAKGEDNLAFAARKYQRLLEACATDEIAKKYRQAIVQLASAPIDERQLQRPPKKMGWRLPFVSLIYLLAAMLMVMGYLLTPERNLVGVGAAILFFTFAVRVYFGTR